jgi:hypothetical protein
MVAVEDIQELFLRVLTGQLADALGQCGCGAVFVDPATFDRTGS